MANWGLIGAATANAPQQTLDDIVAQRLADQMRQQKADEAALDMAAKRLKMSLDVDANKRENVSNERGGEYLKIAQGQEGRAGQKFQNEQTDRASQQQFESGLDDATRRVVGLKRLNVDPADLVTPEDRLNAELDKERRNLENQKSLIRFRSANSPQGSAPKPDYAVFVDENGKRVMLEKGEGAKRGLEPSRMLSSKETEDRGTLKTADQMIQDIIDLGDKTNWDGIGGLWSGSVKQGLAKNFGIGADDEMRLRAKIGNLRGDVMHQRLGAALTKQELATAESYLAGIDQDPRMAKVLLQEYANFLRSTRSNRFGRDEKADTGGNAKTSPTPPSDKTQVWNSPFGPMVHNGTMWVKKGG